MPHWSKQELPPGLSAPLLEEALNHRVISALDGDHPNPEQPLIALLTSDAPISRDVRERLAIALDGSDPAFPRLKFVGAGPKSDPGLIATRRDWLDLAENFEASGLSEPEFLAKSNILDERSRKLLQDAKAFSRSFSKWLLSEHCRAKLDWAAAHHRDESDRLYFERMAFAEWVVESDLTDPKRLRDFLQGG